MAKIGTVSTCTNCNRRISFGLYFLAKGFSVKRWTHAEGSMSCLMKPKDWVGEWPKATPTGGRP
jgi:hypothetical protein